MQNGHHHCDQWAKLPQIHILDYMFGTEDKLKFKLRKEFEFEKILKKKTKGKEKEKRRWPRAPGPPHLLSLSAQAHRPLDQGHLGQAQLDWRRKTIEKEKGSRPTGSWAQGLVFLLPGPRRQPL